MSYDALNRAANRVAHTLIALRGTAPEAVGLLLDRNASSIAVLLGVLKAGKFYVPLDPSYPPDRLAFVVKDCRPAFIVTDGRHDSLARQVAGDTVTVVCADQLQRSPTADNPSVAISPDALAAVLYTSGSTGQPKGVMQTHRLVLHRIMVDTNAQRFSADDRLSLLSSPSYGVSLRHLFGALLNGGAVYPFDVSEYGLTELAAWLERERITIYFSVPTTFRQLIGSLTEPRDFSSLRILHLGGEEVTMSDFELYKLHFPPHCVFVNSLASTETGILTIYQTDATRHVGTEMPAGYPVTDKEILILDDDGNELPPNEVGQLAVRSELLSPGYWGQPELTADAFPAAQGAPGKRIYRTGDRGMLLPDGCLLYYGRGDRQIKIRGIRVEIEEVEAALRAHPSVDQAVVVAREDEANQHRLIAYVVPRLRQRLTVSGLRTSLGTTLPSYMVPAAFVFLKELPLTPHGKLDRLALPTPDPTRRQVEIEFAPPRDRLEQRIAALCESTLGVSPIGVSDDLFELGGDSLTMLRLAAEIEEKLGRALPPGALFECPTIADLAAVLRDDPRGRPESTARLVNLQRHGGKPPIFWMHADVYTAALPRFLDPDQPVYGIEHQGVNGEPAHYTDVETIAAHYVAQIREKHPTGPYILGGYSFGAVLALEAAQQITRRGDEVLLLALLDPPSLNTRSRPPAPELLEPSEVIARRTFRGELQRHVGQLASLTWNQRLTYATSRAKRRVEKTLGLAAARRRIERGVYHAYLALGWRLPLWVRSCYIFDIYTNALRRYQPAPYTGRAVLVKGRRRRYHTEGDWEQLLTGHCAVHSVPIVHGDLRTRTHMHHWAETLALEVSEAQTQAAFDV